MLMNTETKREDVAAKRLILITPLLEEGLDIAKITVLKKEIKKSAIKKLQKKIVRIMH